MLKVHRFLSSIEITPHMHGVTKYTRPLLETLRQCLRVGLGVGGGRHGAERRARAAGPRHRQPRPRGARRRQHCHRDVAGGPRNLALTPTPCRPCPSCAPVAHSSELTTSVTTQRLICSAGVLCCHASIFVMLTLYDDISLQASRSYSAPLDMTRKSSGPLTIVTSGSHMGSGVECHSTVTFCTCGVITCAAASSTAAPPPPPIASLSP